MGSPTGSSHYGPPGSNTYLHTTVVWLSTGSNTYLHTIVVWLSMKTVQVLDANGTRVPWRKVLDRRAHTTGTTGTATVERRIISTVPMLFTAVVLQRLQRRQARPVGHFVKMRALGEHLI